MTLTVPRVSVRPSKKWSGSTCPGTEAEASGAVRIEAVAAIARRGMGINGCQRGRARLVAVFLDFQAVRRSHIARSYNAAAMGVLCAGQRLRSAACRSETSQSSRAYVRAGG